MRWAFIITGAALATGCASNGDHSPDTPVPENTTFEIREVRHAPHSDTVEIPASRGFVLTTRAHEPQPGQAGKHDFTEEGPAGHSTSEKTNEEERTGEAEGKASEADDGEEKSGANQEAESEVGEPSSRVDEDPIDELELTAWAAYCFSPKNMSDAQWRIIENADEAPEWAKDPGPELPEPARSHLRSCPKEILKRNRIE